MSIYSSAILWHAADVEEEEGRCISTADASAVLQGDNATIYSKLSARWKMLNTNTEWHDGAYSAHIPPPWTQFLSL